MVAENEISDLLMNRQSPVQVGDHVPAGLLVRKDPRIRKQFRRDFSVLLGNDSFLNPIDACQLFLQRFRRDIFAVCEDDQVFLAAAIMDEALTVNPSQISGMKPAVLKSLKIQDSVFVITRGNAVTTDTDLTINNPDLTARKRTSDGTDDVGIGQVRGDDGRALGDPTCTR